MSAPKLSLGAVRSLGRALVNLPALVGQDLDARTREAIVLHVSSMNSCAVCSAAHGVLGRRAGLGAEQIAAARSPDLSRVADERLRTALRFAELRTLGLEADAAEDVARFEAAFTPPEQRAVRALVDLFTFNNRFNNTWEAVLPGATRRRRRLGIPVDP